MSDLAHSGDLRGARFEHADLRDARFTDADLSGAALHDVVLVGAEIDTAWLYDGTFLINGVDVVPLVEAELQRRFPGRSGRHAADPDALRAAWDAVERAWSATVTRAESMPAGTVDASVAGEWSITQTLRHLVLATDLWLGRVVQGLDEPFHPLGLPHSAAEGSGFDMSVFTTGVPTWAEVLAARASRVAAVRDYLATVSAADLESLRKSPWVDREDTVRSCLQTILEEEWEHLRFATRDLDALDRAEAPERST